MSMQLIPRRACAVTGKEDLEPLFTFESFPVFMGCTTEPESADLKANMAWAISRGSGLIQLQDLIPLEILYPASHGAGCIGGLWQKHHQAFADFICSFSPKAVFEIGGHHGILANNCFTQRDMTWTILEPNPVNTDQTRIRFIKGFFDRSFQPDMPFDAIVHSHVFEHLYEPNEFMKTAQRLLRPGEYLLFSVPRLELHMRKHFIYCIGFEHSIFLTEPYIEYLLANNGFELVRKEYFLDDHSIFYAARRTNATTQPGLSPKLYEQNRSLFCEYLDYHRSLVEEFNRQLAGTTRPVYLFGAHALSQYLLAFGLKPQSIVSLLDNDPNKQGKRLYGTSLRVQSPKVLAEQQNPIVILKTGVFNEEIKQQIRTTINANVEFWE